MAAEMGRVYRCPVCGAEITVVSPLTGEQFHPVCCNVPMVARAGRQPTWFCPRCGSEILLVHEAGGDLQPVCCDMPMVRRRAA